MGKAGRAVGWSGVGIGVAFNAWNVYGRRPITDEAIRQEQDLLRRR
jgi:hypothetical protein